MDSAVTDLPQSTADWQALAAELLAAADNDPKTLAELLKKHLPLLVAHLQESAKAKALLNLWGQSRNYDASGKPLVEPVVLQAFSRLTGIALDPRHPHAGFQHTYGYLLSLPSAQGHKAARWLQLAAGLSPSLSPLPTQGTLLLNLSSFFLVHLPFLRRQRVTSQTYRPYVKAIAELTVGAWQILQENVTTGLRLRQVFLPCLHNDHYCYSYWYQQPGQRRWQLVTVYVVDKNFLARLQKMPLGSKKAPVDIRLRNNLYLEAYAETSSVLGWRAWRDDSENNQLNE